MKNSVDILIIDDDELSSKILISQLSKNKYIIQRAKNGTDALELVEISRPRIILLDIQMEGMSGIEVLKKIRENYTASELPIVMISTISDRDTVFHCIAAGANDFLLKPIDQRVARSRIEAHLSKKEALLLFEKNKSILETLSSVQQFTKSLDNDFKKLESLFNEVMTEIPDDKSQLIKDQIKMSKIVLLKVLEKLK